VRHKLQIPEKHKRKASNSIVGLEKNIILFLDMLKFSPKKLFFPQRKNKRFVSNK
jgi:hypothetical protein